MYTNTSESYETPNKALQRTRLGYGRFSRRSVRAAELGR